MFRKALALSLAVAAVACTTPDRTSQLSALKPPLCSHPYHCNVIGDDPDPKRLVIVSASGGGSRAAALLLGTLRALDKIPMPTAANPNLTLLDQVDVISSVSGGSLTAAAYGLDEKEGLEKADRWLHDTDMTDIILRYANPKSSVGNWFPGRAQIDVLIDMLSEEELFGRRTYAQMNQRPYIVLNAADMGASAVFSFTQPNFDLICSDLDKFAVADAVAGSAAYPFGFGALTLRNHTYPGCPAHEAGKDTMIGDEPRWPPPHLNVAVSYNRLAYRDVEVQRRNDLQKSYFYNPGNGCSLAGPSTTTPQCKEWLHLLDGGIADNLGVTAPLLMLTSLEGQPSFVADIASGRIQEVIFIVVNARGDKDAALEASSDSPGWIAQILAVTGSPIDATTSLLESRVESGWKGRIIEDELMVLNLVERLEKAGDLPPGGALDEKMKLVRDRIEGLKTTSALIDFDLIPVQCGNLIDGECEADDIEGQQKALWRLRRYVKSIPTNWWLDDHDLRLTQEIARCLVHISQAKADIEADQKIQSRRGKCFMPLTADIPADFK